MLSRAGGCKTMTKSNLGRHAAKPPYTKTTVTGTWSEGCVLPRSAL
jgi:hypothetical protein